ncbi:MAG TPA: NAD-dependent malic enzyme [Acidimicrobiales bacterium]|nr:NAD-dependent malic enzyme [Acidimicrobiales bacterium]
MKARAFGGRLETPLRGRQVLADPRLNHGTAFTADERDELGLVGLLPPEVLTLDQQAGRAYAQYCRQRDDLGKNVFLSLLQDRNEVLFFRLVGDHLNEMLPIVYTPTVGDAIRNYSGEYRRPRGVYLSVDHPKDLERSLAACGRGPDEIDLVVATDGEAILGIGDWGVGGIAISAGKLAVYTAAAGIDPDRTLPVVLDVGTNRDSLLEDPLYLGNRHRRVDTDTYDAFIDRYVRAATTLFPNALLHWEDLGAGNARRVLDRYKDELLTFNDDIQGTGAVTLAAVFSALQANGTPLSDQRIVIYGAGTAGIGIAEQLADAMAAEGVAEPHSRLWALSSRGLLVDSDPAMRDYQRPFARPAGEVAGYGRDGDGRIGLAEVVRRVSPTVLIGTSGQPGAFSEEIVREMSRGTRRPVIMPLSNPTSLSEALPGDLFAWTDGRALVATGSPFDPVTVGTHTYVVAQANNALVFPGIGLGAVLSEATRITPRMIRAAADAVASRIDSSVTGAPLLPPVEALQETSVAVAVAVVLAAADDGVAPPAGEREQVEKAVRAAMWQPVYRPVVAS